MYIVFIVFIEYCVWRTNLGHFLHSSHYFHIQQILFNHFFLGIYKYAISLVGCSSLFTVINSLAFLSVSCSSFLFHYSYSSTIPQNGDCLGFQCHYLIPAIHFTLQNQFCRPKILILELIFHFLFFYSVILQYPQVFISIFFHLLSFHHLVILFCLLTYLFSIHNNRATPIIKSSLNRRWLIFSPPPKLYLALALHITWVSGIMHITNNKWDKLSPWKIPPFMLTFAKLSPHEFNSVCQFAIDLFTNLRMLSDTCRSSRLSNIQEWGTIS